MVGPIESRPAHRVSAARIGIIVLLVLAGISTPAQAIDNSVANCLVDVTGKDNVQCIIDEVGPVECDGQDLRELLTCIPGSEILDCEAEACQQAHCFLEDGTWNCIELGEVPCQNLNECVPEPCGEEGCSLPNPCDILCETDCIDWWGIGHLERTEEYPAGGWIGDCTEPDQAWMGGAYGYSTNPEDFYMEDNGWDTGRCEFNYGGSFYDAEGATVTFTWSSTGTIKGHGSCALYTAELEADVEEEDISIIIAWLNA